MLISKSKKVIFLEVPKTGSMSLSDMIIQSGFFSTDEDVKFRQHVKLSHAVENGLLTEEFIKECTVYAFMRNPFDRVLSAWNHDKKTNDKMLEVMDINPIPVFRKGIQDFEDFIRSSILRQPQSFIFEGRDDINILKFENYDSEIRKVFERHDVPFNSVVVKNVRRSVESPVTVERYYDEETRRFVRYHYRRDFELWEAL